MSFAHHQGGDITATLPNICTYVGSPGGSVVENPPAGEETRIQSQFQVHRVAKGRPRLSD